MSRVSLRSTLVLLAGLLALPIASAAQIPDSILQDTAKIRQAVQQMGGQMTPGLQQLTTQGLKDGVSHSQIIEQLRQAGISRGQMRQKLIELGYEPTMLDRYFDVIERGGEPPRGQVGENVIEAFRFMGMPVRQAPDSTSIDMMLADSMSDGQLGMYGDSMTGPNIFGRALFFNRTSQFMPVMTGPVGPNYEVGPDDELSIYVTGDVEASFRGLVEREGFVIIPDIGEVHVAGLTLEQVRQRLRQRMGEVYSGIRDGSTRFEVSLGRLRTNQVFVIGEVNRPGNYQVGPMETAFNALYRALGPSIKGSYRRVQVQRGGEVIREIDLYDYLVHGDASDDVRLLSGDIIFVPLSGPHIEIKGAVRRPMIYEITEDENLRDLLTYAGGFEPEAVVQRIQIDRIVPPEQRRPGIDRVLVDVNVANVIAGETVPELSGGDLVEVFAVSGERRHRLVVTGEVRRPGTYEWSEGMTLFDVIDRAEGLRDAAYTARAHVYRLQERDGSRRLIQTALVGADDTAPVRDVLLADRDSIVIFSRDELRNRQVVAIDGFVKHPGTYELAEGMTIQDLVLTAGGFVHGAYTIEAEVARQPAGMQRGQVSAEVLRVPLVTDPVLDAVPGRTGLGDAGAASFAYGSNASDRGPASIPEWTPNAAEFDLRHGDRVFVRRAPGYELPRTVTVTGEVGLPGTYVLSSRDERITNLIKRAGGLTPEAYPDGFQLVRDSSLVATDLKQALAEPGSFSDLMLQADDSVHVPKYDGTVLVQGAVAFPTRVLYRPGQDLEYYISQAGGFVEVADKERISITYQNGERQVADKFLVFDRMPRPQPGATVLVPEKPASEREGFNWDQFISRSLSIATTMLTLLLTAQQLDN